MRSVFLCLFTINQGGESFIFTRVDSTNIPKVAEGRELLLNSEAFSNYWVGSSFKYLPNARWPGNPPEKAALDGLANKQTL